MRLVRRTYAIFVLLPLLLLPAFAQTDRGTITGTVLDATMAVIPGVNITARNTQTSATYETVSTETGNYTLTQLPAGVYELVAELPGFKKYVRSGITVLSAQALRIDPALEVGAAGEEVAVSADAPLLRTESSELAHNIRTDTLTNLPILLSGAAAGSSGIRNPTIVATLLPGTYVQANSNVRVNGAPGNTA